MRYAAKRDASEKTIVDALRKAGCEVYTASDVDLFVSAPNGLWGIECKTAGSEKRLQPIQKWLRLHWDRYRVISTPEDALRLIGRL